MHSTHSYPAIKRFDIGKKIAEKRYLKADEARFLLGQRVMVEEKMDGKPVAFETKRFTLFAEDMKTRHSINYRVPARYALFDVYDNERGLYLGVDKLDVYKDIKTFSGFFKDTADWGGLKNVSGESFFLAKVLDMGMFSINDLPDLIKFTDYYVKKDQWMEGIVVKTMRDCFPVELRAGKLVRKEFLDGIETHYSRKKLVFNIIDPLAREVNPFLESKISIPGFFRYKQEEKN